MAVGLRSFFYAYLIAPLRTIDTALQVSPVKPALFTLLLFSLGTNLGFSMSVNQPILLMIGLTFLFQFFIIMFQSVLIDFIAQCFALKAQSLTLFSWLGMALFPSLVLTPFSLLHYAGLLPSFLFMIVAFGVTLWSIYLMVRSISVLYQISFFKAVCLSLTPLLLIAIIVIYVIANIVGSVFMEAFL